MRTLHARWFVIFGALCLALSATVLNVGCGDSTAPPTENITSEKGDSDAGGNTEQAPNNNNNTNTNTNNNNNTNTNTNNNNNNTNTNNNNTNTNNNNNAKTCTKKEDCKESEACEDGKCVNNCAPGCQNCTRPDPDNLALGASCERTTEKPNACDKSKGLDCAPFGVNSTTNNPSGTCLNSCQSDADCTKIRVGLKCLEFTAGNVTVKACALRNKAGDPCNSNEQVYCASGNVCLLSSNDGSGVCIKECQNTAQCDKGQVCRQAIASNTRTFCLQPVLSGPKCIGETCDFTRRPENCLNGLVCFKGVCVQPCDKANNDKDCETSRGDKCFKRLFSSDPSYCRGPESVKKVGEECNTTSKLCDSSLGLQCVSNVCAKSCDASKGEKNNPDCASIAGSDCKTVQTQGGNVTLCQKAAKANERCGTNAYCPEGTRCIPLSSRPFPICYVDCDPCKSTRKAGTQTWTHPNCDGGKSSCTALQYSDGRPAGGVCIPRGNPVLGKNEQCTDPEKSCKDGLLCVRFGSSEGSTVCSNFCDISKGSDKNPDCDGGRCGSLSDGRGICIPQGKPVLPEGSFCGDDLSKGCVETAICVNFSNEEDAKGICSKKCKPNNQGGDGSECPSGECLGLTSGGGVCSPQRKRSKKLGEKCRGPRGTPRFDECLETDGGKKVQCAPVGDNSSDRTCMLSCDPSKGAVDNKDCKDAGLNNHLCLPDKDRPELGACVEKCTFTNRLRCETSKCQYGACQEKQLDTQQGQCTDAAKEEACKKRGGTCNSTKTCVVSACL